MQTRHAPQPPRPRRRKSQGRPDLPEQLRLIEAPQHQRRPIALKLGLAVIFSLGGLLAASVAIDHCARDARFCPQPRQTATVLPDAQPRPPAPDTAPNPVSAPVARPVLAHAFAPLPMSLNGESTRNFVLPPGTSMLDMATETGRIDVNDVALIAVVRQDGVRHALVRLPDGRILRLQQGDALDGGTVAAISEDAVYLIGPDMAPRALVLGG